MERGVCSGDLLAWIVDSAAAATPRCALAAVQTGSVVERTCVEVGRRECSEGDAMVLRELYVQKKNIQKTK